MAVYKANPQFDDAMRKAVAFGVDAFLVIIGDAVREQLSKPGTGKRYRVSKGRGRRARNTRESGIHVASAPGSPPAADTGTLRRSWQVGRGGAVVRRYSTDTRIGLAYGSPLRYARIERRFGRVKARPYIKPTIAAVKDLFEPTMARAIRRTTGGAG